MDPLSSFASIIAVLQLSEVVLGSCYRYAGKVKDAASDIDRVIHQVGYLTTILRDLKSLMEPGGALSDASAHGKTLSSLAGDHGPLTICAQNLEELASKLPTGPVGLRQKLQWPFESKKINAIMDRIMAQIPVLELAMAQDHVGLTSKIMGSLEETKQREEREKILSWLRCFDPTVKHLESRRLHQPGSNHWVIESESYKEWRDTSGQVLWLHGIPGAGKTIICSTIIDNIEDLCTAKPESRLAYYYFDFRDQETLKLDIFLRCLIWQLCKNEEWLSAGIVTLYGSCDNGRKKPSDEDLANALFEISRVGPARRDYIIIDALDECPIDTRERFYELVLDRIGRCAQTSTYNFLFTSRKEPDIEQSITALGVTLHNMPIVTGEVDADVRLHVSEFILNHRTMKDWTSDLRTEIEEAIANGAHGI